MGATGRTAEMCGASVKEAWNELLENERYDRGYGSYNGSLANCDLCRTFDLDLKGKTKAGRQKAINEMIDRLFRRCEKREAFAIDLGVQEYRVTSTKVVASDETLKLRYVVTVPGKGYPYTFDNLADAKAKAMRLALEHGTSVGIRRAYVNDHGQGELFSAKLVTKTFKTRPKHVPNGAKLEAIHRYIFVGIAPE